MPDQLPGANVLALMMQAPADVVGLATRQMTEAVDTFSIGVQRLGAELAVPPDIAGMGLPMLPAFPGMEPATAREAAPQPAAAKKVPTRRAAPSRIII